MAAKKGARKGRRKGRKSSKRMGLATMPTQRTIALSAGEASQTDGIIEVSRLLSQVNNRQYRQGMVYDVSFALTEGMIYASDAAKVPLQLNFYTLPNNWFTLGAIRHAFKQWRATLQDELSHTGGKHAKWLDFSIKPNADGSPESNIFYPNFWDGNTHVAVSTGYEQTYTALTDSDGDNMQFLTGGAEDKSGAGGYNIMLEFARHLLSRRADSTSESGPQSYEGIQAGLDELDAILETGDEPPWDQDFGMYHGDADSAADTRLVWADSLYVGRGSDSNDTNSASSASRLVTRSFAAPLGLVFVEASTAFVQTSDSEMAVIAKSGKYKGVSATPIFHHELVGSTAKSLR